MPNIAIISSIRKDANSVNGNTLSHALASQNMSRIPGAGVRFTPWKEGNKYRTGLDENSSYIKKLEKLNPEYAEQEKTRVRELKAKLEMETGLDLSPTSDFYKTHLPVANGEVRAKAYKLRDGQNKFDLDDPMQAIDFYWLSAHEFVAPSYEAYIGGKVKHPQLTYFFVDNEEYKNDMEYKEKTLINKAIGTLDSMSPEKQFKVARLIGLPVRHDDKPHVIYNAIDTFIKMPKGRGSKRLENVNLFTSIISMNDENLNVRFIIEEAFKYSVYRIKGSRVVEGENVVADSKEELIQNLSTVNYQDDLLALQEKVRQRKLQEV